MKNDRKLVLNTIHSPDEMFYDNSHGHKYYRFAMEYQIEDQECHYVLPEEIAEWCWENIGAYRLRDHRDDHAGGSDYPRSVVIEFKTDVDMMAFKLRWF